MTVLAMLPLSTKQEAEILRLHRLGWEDWTIAFHLEQHDRQKRDIRLGQVTRLIDREFPNRKKKLQGA